MKKILVTTDFSKNAHNALSYAHLLFEPQEVTFVLLYAYQPSAVQLLGKSPVRLAQIYKSLEIQAEKQLKDLTDTLKANNVNTKHDYTFLAVSGTLLEALHKIQVAHYDYLVMGSKGATGLREVFWGSNTYHVVKEMLNIPLLIIPEKAAYATPQKIGLPTNFAKAYNNEVLAPLRNIIDTHDSRLALVEIYKEPSLDEEQEKNYHQLQELLQGIPHSFHVVPFISNLESSVAVFTTELAIDLLVLIHYPKSMLAKLVKENLIKEVTLHTAVPLLILPSLT